MKQNRMCIQGILAAVCLLILILDSDLALRGAKSGIDLCIKTIIPSLFPFFVLSTVLTKSISECHLSLLQIPAKLLGIPSGAVSVVIPAFLGGYPVGAKCISDLYQEKRISRRDAERLLSFCSNAGPSFLFGMISAFFKNNRTVWFLWLIHILSAALTAVITPKFQDESTNSPSVIKKHDVSPILSAARAMLLVCCWVTLFRIIITFCKAWFLWLLPDWVQVLFIGILELTNGCCELTMISDPKLRFVLCSCMLSFGGICIMFQTASVLYGLSLWAYTKGKLIQTGFSFLLSFTFVSEPRLAFGLTAVSCLTILINSKKGIVIPDFFLYNKENKLPEA